MNKSNENEVLTSKENAKGVESQQIVNTKGEGSMPNNRQETMEEKIIKPFMTIGEMCEEVGKLIRSNLEVIFEDVRDMVFKENVFDIPLQSGKSAYFAVHNKYIGVVKGVKPFDPQQISVYIAIQPTENEEVDLILDNIKSGLFAFNGENFSQLGCMFSPCVRAKWEGIKKNKECNQIVYRFDGFVYYKQD